MCARQPLLLFGIQSHACVGQAERAADALQQKGLEIGAGTVGQHLPEQPEGQVGVVVTLANVICQSRGRQKLIHLAQPKGDGPAFFRQHHFVRHARQSGTMCRQIQQ